MTKSSCGCSPVSLEPWEWRLPWSGEEVVGESGGWTYGQNQPYRKAFRMSRIAGMIGAIGCGSGLFGKN